MKKFIIAIDGGGTKTVGVLADMHGDVCRVAAFHGKYSEINLHCLPNLLQS